MNITITPAPLSGTIDAIPSKSYAHRILICAALADKKTTIKNLFYSKDIVATQNALRALGCSFENETVTPCPFKHQGILDCNESGSTLRFMLPLALAIGGEFTFKMTGRLSERPLSPLRELLCEHGCSLSEQGENPFFAKGKLTPGVFEIAGNISSQFITGLLLALPLLNGDSEIRITSELESKPYIDITLDVQKQFGIDISFKNNTFYVKGNQIYQSPEIITVENDWSNGAFWISANALSGNNIICTGLNNNSVQGDRAIENILKDLPCTICAKAIPDLVPIICGMAAVTPGKTIINGALRLKLKESDRLETVKNVLSTLGADIVLTDDGMIVHGKTHLDGGVVDSYNDHRIAMMTAIVSCKCKKRVTIQTAEAVEKSYPAFWQDFKKLGGIIKEEL